MCVMLDKLSPNWLRWQCLFAVILERINPLRLAPGKSASGGRTRRQPDEKDRGSIVFFRVEGYFRVVKQVFSMYGDIALELYYT